MRLVGTKFHPPADLALMLAPPFLYVALERDAGNAHDPNAVKVIVDLMEFSDAAAARLRANGATEPLWLGFIDRESAEVHGPRLDDDALTLEPGWRLNTSTREIEQ